MDKKAKDIDITINRIDKAPDIPSLVVNQMIELISSGVLKPGDKLPSELEMTRRFGISRISLREAMKLLEAKGFIESHGRKGKYVKSVLDNALKSPIEDLISIDQKKAWELLTVRRILDSEAAALAAMTATDKQMEKFKTFKEEASHINIDEMIHLREGGKLYAEFYNNLYEATNNTVFAHLLKSISSIIREVLPYSRQKLIKIKGSSRVIYEHHLRILEAIEAKNAELAKELTVEHIDYLEKHLRKAFKERQQH